MSFALPCPIHSNSTRPELAFHFAYYHPDNNATILVSTLSVTYHLLRRHHVVAKSYP
ncbi:hypothetical protein VAS14_22944 [Vibrio angustum S14]|uniref:Uncharacterized protein n=1 Tax=Photobacterium angustum (strain S14 / CCUG 15956) TaxID=314292 RepID=Q1ZL86_PHOAS|nr:hypothetical protein VAS14_22944 [Vibrio angustum S14] [Photobacterium angustum S14]